ncbi:hypothetical protein ACH518_17735 [Methylomonas sp. HW2-6]|uniref:hypothetical protein n=1 Tax=Methylomonas sp. HW2-6 TaxID=3376687 RepID=UPI004041C9F9
MEKKKIAKILEAAILAPSGDNTQPWQFSIAEDYSGLVLYNLPEKDYSYYNYQQVASYISHGAVIENIAIAARHLGLSADIGLFPNPSNANQIANINLSGQAQVPDPLYEAIFNRSTNRFKYRSARSTIFDLNLLKESIVAIPEASGHFATSSNTIKKLAKVLMINDALAFECQEIHEFLFKQIRWNQKQINENCDGMPLDALGLNLIEKLIFPLMRFWKFVVFGNRLGLSKMIGLKCWYNLHDVDLIGMVCVKNADRAGFIHAGRAMQRIWLEATRQSLSFQPIVGLPLLFYRSKREGLNIFPERRQKQIVHAETELRNLFEIDSSEELIIGFRIGRALKRGSRTPRIEPAQKIEHSVK